MLNTKPFPYMHEAFGEDRREESRKLVMLNQFTIDNSPTTRSTLGTHPCLQIKRNQKKRSCCVNVIKQTT